MFSENEYAHFIEDVLSSSAAKSTVLPGLLTPLFETTSPNDAATKQATDTMPSGWTTQTNSPSIVDTNSTSESPPAVKSVV